MKIFYKIFLMNRDKNYRNCKYKYGFIFWWNYKRFYSRRKIELKNGFYKQTFRFSLWFNWNVFYEKWFLTHEDIKLIHKIIFSGLI